MGVGKGDDVIEGGASALKFHKIYCAPIVNLVRQGRMSRSFSFHKSLVNLRIIVEHMSRKTPSTSDAPEDDR